MEDTEATEAETAIAETTATEAEMIVDPEEISATGPKAASTAARMDTSPETAPNVNYLLTFQPENPETTLPETETTGTETNTEEGAEAEAVTDTENTEREAHQDQAEADRTLAMIHALCMLFLNSFGPIYQFMNLSYSNLNFWPVSKGSRVCFELEKQRNKA